MTRQFVADAINYFGSGEHPMAEANRGLEFFNRDYAVECVTAALKSGRINTPKILVRLYSYSADGENEAFECESDVALSFPDDVDSLACAIYDLAMTGTHVIGGGAAPLFKMFTRERWLDDATPAPAALKGKSRIVTTHGRHGHSRMVDRNCDFCREQGE